MLQRVDRSFIGEGQVMARLFGTQDPLLPLGNCDSFAISFTMDQKKLPNYQGGGGNNNSTSRPSDVTASIGMYDITPENVALVTRGTIKVAPTASQPDEPHVSTGVLYELIPFNYMPDLTKPVTVKTAGDEPLVPGTDYLLTQHGIQVLSGSAIDATGVKVTYTPRPSKSVQMLNGSQQEFELFLAGLNDAQNGEPYALRPRRVKFGLLQELAGLSQDYMKLTGPCDLLADPTVAASDISKFCAMDLATAA
ncbi:hypothetical protein OSS47_00430 [Pseudomonas citronellolis]|uniref:phage tail tube protein n=1 Tax=Pseudomonas citronellolis TaxID=53408 RepID=UPI00226ECA83|nr:hypothetical protein [Pseudomonas citronellolis]WAB92480.1 hypothetical protein OSS47_00430 [Pseudomonas citronellolis]